MQQESACPEPSRSPFSATLDIPFADIPGQSKLFIDYQADPVSLKRFYPGVVGSHREVIERIPDVLSRYSADRGELCDALEEMNRKFGASERTLQNIAMLRESDSVAVVSGQQAGLLTGPLYTIYKALSAVKTADDLRRRGVKAVPVFWAATEDHDFDEVSRTFVLDRENRLTEVKNEPKRCHDDLPVGYVKLDDSIRRTLAGLFDALPMTEHTDELRGLLDDIWIPQTYYGDAFARLLNAFIGKYGLIILCPLDSRLKTLASPIYVNAIRHSDEIVRALQARSEELTAEGYAAQVFVGDDYFPLFWQARDGTRNALKKSENGTFHTKDGAREFTLDELAETAERDPSRFSPSVVLRSVVQDHLLPTVCYFGGAAEIAYFAQSSEVYRILDRPPTPILHRQSFSLIERRFGRTMEKFGIDFEHLFAGLNALIPELVDRHLNIGTSALIADVEERINIELNRLDQNFLEIDPTLSENLATRRRKVIYHISALRDKFRAAQFNKDQEIRRRVETLFSSTMPHGHLQERSLNVLHFVNRYGPDFIDWLYDGIDLDNKDHRVLYL